jgi:hypothetical protein
MEMGRGRNQDERNKRDIFAHYARYGEGQQQSREQEQRHEQATASQEAQSRSAPEQSRTEAETNYNAYMAQHISRNTPVGEHATDLDKATPSPEAAERVNQMSDEAKRETAEAAQQIKDVFSRYAQKEHEQSQERERERTSDKGDER